MERVKRMHRAEKAITDYRRYIERTGRGGIYFDDLNDIYEMNKNTNGGRLSIFGAIGDALEVGFMIGYRCAKRETRNRKSS